MRRTIFARMTPYSGILAAVAVLLALSVASPVRAANLMLDGFDDIDGPVGWTAQNVVSPTSTPTSTATLGPTETPCLNMTTTETCTPTSTPTNTVTPTNTPTHTPTHTRIPDTPRPGANADCHIAAPGSRSGTAWVMLIPAALVLLARRRRG